MKSNLRIIASLFVMSIALGLSPSQAESAQPAPQSSSSVGNISVGGTVSLVCTITYTQNANALNLNLYGGEPNGVQIGAVREWCNADNFTVTLTSAHRGLKLSGSAANHNAAIYVYEIGYAAPPATIYGSSADEKLEVRRPGPQFDVEVPVMMRFGPMTRMANGSYLDVLTITVNAN